MSEDDFPTKKVQELYDSRVKELQANSMLHENVTIMDHKISEIHTMMKSLTDKENVPGTVILL